MLMNTVGRYGSVAKFFHWTIFLLLIGLVLVGFFWEQWPAPQKFALINAHKLLGLTVLLLVILRLAWRALNVRPVMPRAIKVWEKVAEYSVQGALYLVLFAMPLSGWVMATAAGHAPHIGTLTLPAPAIPRSPVFAAWALQLHSLLAWCLISLVALHALAAFKHHWINKDTVLKRMLPWGH